MSDVRHYHRSFKANAALPRHTRVALNASMELVTAAAASGAIGHLERPSLADEMVAVYMYEPTRTVLNGSVATINAGDEVIPATGGWEAGAGGYVALNDAAPGEEIELAKLD